MLQLPLLFALVTLSSCVVHARSPIVIRDNLISLPMARRMNLNGTGSGHRLVQHDQARARHLISRVLNTHKRDDDGVPVPVTDIAVTYVVDVSTGSSPTTYSLIVDTGSSNTWVGADLKNWYNPVLPLKQQQGPVSVTYGSGSFSGLEVVDSLAIGDLHIKHQSIGAAAVASGFQDVDGILGIGPTDLTAGTVELLGPETTINTVVDNAFEEGTITRKMVGISFEPSTSATQVNGQLMFGGIDSSKYTGALTTVPITSTSPASHYVGINQTITYGGSPILQSSGITDTGTTLLLLAQDAFQKYQVATGATPDSKTGLLKIDAAGYAGLQSLYFNIGGVDFEFTKNAQLWPRSLNTQIGGDTGSYYLIVASLGDLGGTGLDFINGMTWLQRFYTLYDSGEGMFSIATTQHTYDETN